ncbi:hypothetical protein Pen02_59060 [Plantactinospora endophytica]|uniref:Uncharacterized protein n=1 Tax=Plantactinospora endophytica TaxID=673535 RepID=A0ABQ4E8A6_9ACTN|nr:hypothetical protein Pen02_59060 [Plantactinospora endophytica]
MRQQRVTVFVVHGAQQFSVLVADVLLASRPLGHPMLVTAVLGFPTSPDSRFHVSGGRTVQQERRGMRERSTGEARKIGNGGPGTPSAYRAGWLVLPDSTMSAPRVATCETGRGLEVFTFGSSDRRAPLTAYS